MPGRIQGITVEIGGDTTKLQTDLKGVNTEIRNTQSQLRDVDKLLKLDPGNTELLAQKHRLLGDAVKETKEKLETLKTAAEQAEQALKDGTITQDAKSQKGAYKILDNAKKCADQNPGYKVFDADGKVVYEPKAAELAVKVPFLVKVSISDLNIRKGPGVNYSRVQFCPPGVYTMVAVSEGAGASMWGKLKSGIGWLSLDFCRRV